ncbi:hypothetical protein C5B94_03890 [Clavibacter michiganensis]|uniref:hypothetical protein n=1 Tax=Clavibacter michiganensis TaxID=28447 RepID=UPI000CE8355D|nr:hypothetical protein [Clavibacter michiganensis]PPF56071.1 hypothetical protein C5B94_03890 [Clavibacter michiganensis]
MTFTPRALLGDEKPDPTPPADPRKQALAALARIESGDYEPATFQRIDLFKDVRAALTFTPLPDREALALAIASRDMNNFERFPGHSPYTRPWPTNAELGGSLTGTRDDEFRASVYEEVDEILDILKRVAS